MTGCWGEGVCRWGWGEGARQRRVKTRPTIASAVPFMLPSMVPDWWSNEPVIGFRMWRFDNGKFRGSHGGFWASRRMTARCEKKRSHELSGFPIPHDEMVCDWPPCGVYAMKRAAPIVETVVDNLDLTDEPMILAAGTVALSGRVIEHEYGYRGEHAEVTSLCTIARNEPIVTLRFHQTPGCIAQVFGNPSGLSADPGVAFPTQIGLKQVAAFLTGLDHPSDPCPPRFGQLALDLRD